MRSSSFVETARVCKRSTRNRLPSANQLAQWPSLLSCARGVGCLHAWPLFHPDSCKTHEQLAPTYLEAINSWRNASFIATNITCLQTWKARLLHLQLTHAQQTAIQLAQRPSLTGTPGAREVCYTSSTAQPLIYLQHAAADLHAVS